MSAETHKFNDARIFIPPYQESVTLYMTLHIPFVVAGQRMRTVLFRNGQTLYQ